MRLEVARVADVFQSHALKQEVSPEAATGEVGGDGGSERPGGGCRGGAPAH